jgi:HD-GYP domain-containing protein (c-di-GMP phosphodiesterase class II)
MGTNRGERLAPALAIAAAAAAAPGLIEWAFGKTPVSISPTIHFYAVGMTALGAAAASIALTGIGARFADTRTVLIGTAFAVMAALLALHGLGTPGFIFPSSQYAIVMITGGLTLPAGAAILALSAFRLPSFMQGVKPLLALEAGLLTVILTLGILGLLYPSLLPEVPAANSPQAIALLVIGLVLFGVLVVRALRTYLLTRRVADLIVVIGLVWLGTSLVASLTLTFSDLGWWLGHMFELNGILIVGIPVALDLAHASQARPLAGDLHAAELVSAEEVFLGSHVRAITLRLAHKDEYTEQHTRRVALRAVQVGELMGLSRGRLRALAIGGLVHDIGKLSVPDSILKKPGPLDDAEYAVVKRHAEWGAKLLDELGGFPDPVRRLVRDHHERLDGRGYPAGRSADELSLDVRILTVCDVYDALISPRVYREAWTHADAMALLHAETGTAFDATCVDALDKLLASEISGAAAGKDRSTLGRKPVRSPVPTW